MPTLSSVDVDIRGSIEPHIRALSALQREVIPQATDSALNKTAVTVRSRSLRAVAAELGLTQKEISGAFKIIKANLTSMRSTIRVRGNPRSLLHAKAKQTSVGVSHKAKHIDNPLLHAFIATMPNGGRGVFKRTTSKRLPIAKQFMAAPPTVFANAEISAANKLLSTRRFNEIFPRELRYRLIKRGLA